MLRTAMMTAIALAAAAPAFAHKIDPQLKQQAETIFYKYLQALNSAYGNALKNLYSPKAVTITLAALFVIALSACSVTEQDKPNSGSTVPTSGFLKDYSQLEPGAKDQALLVYFNPNARWSRYDKVMLEPVTVGLGPDQQLSEKDQQMLSSYYYHVLEQDLSKDFTLANKPGRGVMTLRVALTDATTATPVLRTISVIVPQARVLGAAKNLATGSYAFVGSAQSEGEVLDSVTGERLAAAVDRRSGGMSIKNAGVWQWGDAEKAMDYWAQRTAERLAELHQGQPVTSQR